MNTTQTLQQMQTLRLQGMHHAYRSQLELPMDQQLESHDLVAQLVQSEQLCRANVSIRPIPSCFRAFQC
jgi:hypothetical protein